jgi:kynurenine formamidase
MAQLIDLAGYLEEGQPVYPGHQETQFWVTATHEESAHTMRKQGYDTSSTERKELAKDEGIEGKHPSLRTILIDEHGPTHVDALTHIDPREDRSIDKMDMEWFYGPAVSLDVSHVDYPDFITVEDLEEAIESGGVGLDDVDHVLLHTGHREENYDVEDIKMRYAYLYEYPGLDEEASYWLAEKGVKNIGIDTPSIDHADAMKTKEYPAHLMCAEHKVINMENMANLDEVIGTEFTLCAMPLKLRGGTGSPIRPFAILD